MGNDAKPTIKSKAAGDVAEFEIKVQSVKKDSTYTIEIMKGGATAKTLSGTWKDGRETKDGVPITISGTTATVKWKAEGPEKTAKDRAHRVFAQVTVTDDKGKELKHRSQEIDVYLDEVEVEVIEDEKGPVKGAAFKLLLDKRAQETPKGKTDDQGKAKLKPVPNGTIGLEFARPYELCEISEQTAATIKATVVPAKKAAILSPKPNAARGPKKEKYLKQLVNLFPDDKQPTFGGTVKLEVQLKDGKEGEVVYVKQTFKNKPAGSGSVGLSGTSGNDGDIKEVTVDAKGKGTVDVYLGQTGGFEIDLEVGGNKKCRDAKLKLVAWRRIYFQVSHIRSVKMPLDLGAVTRCYAEPFVELVEEKATERTALDPDTHMKDAWIAASLFKPGAEGKLLNVYQEIAGPIDTLWAARSSFSMTKVHIVLCNLCMSPAEEVTIEGVVDKTTRKVRFKEEGEVVGAMVLSPEKPILGIDLKTGGSPFVSGTWSEVGGSRQGALGAADVDPQFRFGPPQNKRHDLDHRYIVNVKLPEAAAKVVADGKRVKVTLTMKAVWVEVLGFAARNRDGSHPTVFVASTLGPQATPTNPTALSHLIAHELGHLFKQACRVLTPEKTEPEPPAGLSSSDHGRQYEGLGHTGRHCAHGLSDDEYGKSGPGTGSLKTFSNLQKATCVMYGDIPWPEKPHGSGMFCKLCLKFIQNQDLSNLTTVP